MSEQQQQEQPPVDPADGTDGQQEQPPVDPADGTDERPQAQHDPAPAPVVGEPSADDGDADDDSTPAGDQA